MNIKDIVTNEYFYIADGGKIHFYFDDEEDGYFLCNGYWIDEYKGRNSENIAQFYIPNTINGKPVVGLDGDTFDGIANLSSFIIEDDNKYFMLYQDGLYSKDMKRMFHMPPDYRQKIFRVPDGVEYIMDSALSDAYINTLILSESCKEIFEYGVSGAKNLKIIYMPKSMEFIGFKAFIGTSPKEVYYEGSEEDKKRIDFTDLVFNAGIINAKWHYECKLPKE